MDNSSIITLQVGSFSNSVGAHWWNVQDATLQRSDDTEFDLKTMFFKGRSHKCNKHTEFPRLLAVDHIVSTVVESYSFSGTDNYCSGVDDVLASQLHETTDSDTCSWQQNLKPELHPNSCAFVSTLQWGQSPETFTSGMDLSMNESCREMLDDKIRLLAEETDYLQGFHVLLDMDNRFGGLACGTLQNLKDDFGNKALFSFPLLRLLRNEQADMKTVKRAQANIAFALSSLHTTSSLIMPLSLENGWLANKLDTKLAQLGGNITDDQEAAFLALALETVSSLWRSAKHVSGMYDAIGSIACSGRKILGTSCDFPFDGAVQTVAFMPEVDAFKGDVNNTVVYRGANLHPEFREMNKAQSEICFEEQSFKTPCYIPSGHPPFPLSPLFPGSYISTKGTLHDSALIGDSMRKLHEILTKKVNGSFLLNLGIEEEDFQEHSSEILNIADMYS